MNVILTVEQGEQMISPMLKSLADVGLGDAVSLPTTPRERRIFAEIVRETVLEFEELRRAAARRPRVVKPPVVDPPVVDKVGYVVEVAPDANPTL